MLCYASLLSFTLPYELNFVHSVFSDFYYSVVFLPILQFDCSYLLCTIKFLHYIRATLNQFGKIKAVDLSNSLVLKLLMIFPFWLELFNHLKCVKVMHLPLPLFTFHWFLTNNSICSSEYFGCFCWLLSGFCSKIGGRYKCWTSFLS